MTDKRMDIRVQTRKQLEMVLNWGKGKRIFLEFPLLFLPVEPLVKSVLNRTCFFASLPDAAREKNHADIRKILQENDWLSGVVVKNLDELGMLEEAGYHGAVVGDSMLYAYNREALRFYLDCFPQMEFICSDELTDRELVQLAETPDLKERMIFKIYGHQQLMVTAQCFGRNYADWKEHMIPFRDEKGERFYAVSECRTCNSRIYNGKPVSMLDKPGEITFRHVLADFTLEEEAAVREVLAMLENFSRGNPQEIPPLRNITRGHHYTGID